MEHEVLEDSKGLMSTWQGNSPSGSLSMSPSSRRLSTL